jgi:hypothetical protein
VLALRNTASDAELREAGADWLIDDCTEILLDSAVKDETILLLGRRTK